MTGPKWNEDNSQYSKADTPFDVLAQHAGPHGVAVVNVNPDGSTQPGWGHERFVRNYSRDFFSLDRIDTAKPFALVMRSMRLLCIDIDGKNDGYVAAHNLHLPPTLAETSKSGDGYHLYYEEYSDWDEALGFGQKDRIRMWQGIDVKSTGVVYHYPQQRWNNLPIAVIPAEIQVAINEKAAYDEKYTFTPARVMKMSDSDRAYEMSMILIALKQPRRDGRDTSLFRSGAALLNLGAEPAYMEEKIRAAGELWGVSEDIINGKIIPNIHHYVWKEE